MARVHTEPGARSGSSSGIVTTYDIIFPVLPSDTGLLCYVRVKLKQGQVCLLR